MAVSLLQVPHVLAQQRRHVAHAQALRRERGVVGGVNAWPERRGETQQNTPGEVTWGPHCLHTSDFGVGVGACRP